MHEVCAIACPSNFGTYMYSSKRLRRLCNFRLRVVHPFNRMTPSSLLEPPVRTIRGIIMLYMYVCRFISFRRDKL
jgi:hypothetical protein